jgi:hypothetical protein
LCISNGEKDTERGNHLRVVISFTCIDE